MCENSRFSVYRDHICAGNLEVKDFLLRVWRHPVGQYTWKGPRGFIDAGLQSMAKLIPLGCSLPDPGLVRARIALFAAAECVQQGRADGRELGIESAAWFSVDEIGRMLADYSLEDGVSCVALWRYVWVMEKGS